VRGGGYFIFPDNQKSSCRHMGNIWESDMRSQNSKISTTFARVGDVRDALLILGNLLPFPRAGGEVMR
jgi:hypothetical protein